VAARRHCLALPEYEGDVKQLSKKYRNAAKNLKAVERLLVAGRGKERLERPGVE